MTMDIPKSATQLPYQSPLTVSGPSVVPVLAAGLVTTAAALGLVWLLNQAEVNVMGWYAN